MRKLIIYIILLISSAAHAGLFGPSNFEECVLDKMKGQSNFMLGTAREACYKSFPVEPLEGYIDNKKIKWEWCSASMGTEMKFCVTDLPKGVRLTKAEAVFFTDDCNAVQQKSGVKSEAKKSLLSNNFEFKVPFGAYKCSQIWFLGFEK